MASKSGKKGGPRSSRSATRPASEQEKIFKMLDELADNDPDLVDRATDAARDPDTGRTYLRDVTDNILKESNPALSATLSAASAFIDATRVPVREPQDLPHFHIILAHATDDHRAASRIFNSASSRLNAMVQLAKTRENADIGPVLQALIPMAEYAINKAIQNYKAPPALH
ncbi:hypothetical protein [Micavibrio aeruginosavorus]|uniref:Uncharacterized protein n=1 Tax=Micavibrio aeruginosavorus EPB TaxID=349215 RepID=M4VH28_9BACT|nr:hypothetical protein [Micavibrio aeruginosavorus]AGH98483.1 hypothetical protein A11S_1680 [Micavibrio aeruginosavorus EPB]